MANIAQIINVLQAMILTAGEKMILTPTYHVFEMYTVHHEATLLPVTLRSQNYQFGGEKIPALSASASKDREGRVHVTLSNLDANQEISLACDVIDAKCEKVTGRVLTAPSIQAHNTFEQPEAVKPVAFTAFERTDRGLLVKLPAKSVVVLEIN
jgi:alpha-N-arabinofuranosidase